MPILPIFQKFLCGMSYSRHIRVSDVSC